MAGHNKWSQIKHKKAKEDAKRGKAFTKIIKEITVAAREGGGDPAGNARLRSLLEQAKELNMPADNATRAIKKGTGELEGAQYEEFTYEGYGPHGVAIMIDSLSDNKNRTVADIRHIFSKHGGALGETGSVNWMFKKSGVIRINNCPLDDDALFERIIAFEIYDIKHQDETTIIICDPKSLHDVTHALKSANLTIEHADLEWIANNVVELTDSQAEDVIAFLEKLDDHDDVNNVYTNMA